MVLPINKEPYESALAPSAKTEIVKGKEFGLNLSALLASKVNSLDEKKRRNW